MSKLEIIVVGGGASGMMAAIQAARRGAFVTILEHMEAPCKKLLATGNGKCNYTNKAQGLDKYYGENPAFVLPVLEQFDVSNTLDFFQSCGVYPKDKNGYIYPYSEQAASVKQILLMEAARLKIKIICNCGIRSIKKEKNRFIFNTKDGIYSSDCCILATGGKTLRASGSDGSGFLYLDNFRHHIIDVVPGLVGLQGKQAFFKDIAGIRAGISLKLYIDNQEKAAEKGELQLTNYGISGIVVFQISRIANRALAEHKNVHVKLNFLPEFSKEETKKVLSACMYETTDNRSCEQALIGLFPNKLIPVLLQEAKINAQAESKKLSALELDQLTRQIRQFRVDITGWNNFDTAQVTAGGVDTNEIDNYSLESKLESGLYFAGEMIDIDGICGGYNLQWAWSSGYVAGLHAATEKRAL